MRRLPRWSDVMPDARLHIALNRARLAVQRRDDQQAELFDKMGQRLDRIEAERAESDRVAREARLRR